MKFKYILQIFVLFTMLCGAYRMEAKVRVYSFEPDPCVEKSAYGVGYVFRKDLG